MAWLKKNKKEFRIRILNSDWEILKEYESNIIPTKDELYLFGDPMEYYQILNLIHNAEGNNFITIIVKKITNPL